MPYDSADVKPHNLWESHQSVQLSFQVLKIISQMSFENKSSQSAYGSEEPLVTTPSGAKQLKKQKKRDRPKVTVDSKAFDDLGIEVPTDPRKAQALSNRLLNEQKKRLEVQKLLYSFSIN